MEALRTRSQIDEEYTRCATLVGDKQFKQRYLDVEIKLLFERMNQLNQEPCIPNAMPGPAPEQAPKAEEVIPA